jgi:thymidylate synthase ThyX
MISWCYHKLHLNKSTPFLKVAFDDSVGLFFDKLNRVRTVLNMNTLSSLVHTTDLLPNGGMVLLLNTGAVITPEDTAMLQALHSRDPRGVESHLQKLAEVGSGNFMEKFYVGYGHKSIGDCGTVTIFFEKVSMLAAKAIQDSLLYSGQECSTRYLDFSKQPFLDPIGNELSRQLLQDLRAFYVASMEPLVASLKERFPRDPSESLPLYEKAIAARAFDILRSFLPAGASTNLSWHANLRQTGDKIALLRHHPLEEVRDIAKAMEEVAKEANPHSFSEKRYDETESFVDGWMQSSYYFDEAVSDFALMHDGVDRTILAQYRDILANRPAKTELPKYIAEVGNLRFHMLLDFGSYRDFQRQRSITQRMPLLTSKYGFHEWYLSELGELRAEATKLLNTFEKTYKTLLETHRVTDLQYLVPMGYRVPIQFSGDLAALSYIAELRATPFVHPTLQARALELDQTLRSLFEQYGYRSHVDPEAVGRFDIRRGKQDIVER